MLSVVGPLVATTSQEGAVPGLDNPPIPPGQVIVIIIIIIIIIIIVTLILCLLHFSLNPLYEALLCDYILCHVLLMISVFICK